MSDPNWTVDAQGQPVMIGLTADETAEYQSLLNLLAGVSCEAMQARFAVALVPALTRKEGGYLHDA